MSKILNIRLPASATTTDFKPQDFNQLKEAVQQIVFQLNTGYSPTNTENTLGAQSWMTAGTGGGFSGHIRGFQDSVGVVQPYGMFMDDADQNSAGTTSENILRMNSPIFGSGIRVEEDTKLFFDYPGQYQINASLQVVNQSNSVREFELWAKNTGTNYPLSNTRFDVPARKSTGVWGHTAAAISGIFTVNDPVNEYLEMAWWSNSTDVYIEHYAARTDPTRPAIPSVILTAHFLSVESNNG